MKTNNRISLRDERDVLEVVPALVGFHPRDSLVAVVLHDDRIYVTARLDLAALDAPDSHRWLAERLTCGRDGPSDGFNDSGGDSADDGGKHEVTTVFLVGYGLRDRAESAVVAMCAAMSALGVQVVGSLVVEDNLWWNLGESGSGHPVPCEGSLAQQVRGPYRRVVACREDLVMSVSAPKGEQEDAMMDLYVAAIETCDEEDCATAGARVLSLMESEQGSDEDYVQAGVAMTTQKVRDHVWSSLTPEAPRRWLPFWIEVLRRTPVGLRTIPLGVTGMIAWVAGEGALMNVCLDEAEKEDPTHSLIVLLKTISATGVSPGLWDEVRARQLEVGI